MTDSCDMADLCRAGTVWVGRCAVRGMKQLCGAAQYTRMIVNQRCAMYPVGPCFAFVECTRG